MEFTEEQIRIIGQVDEFCDEYVTEEKVRSWVEDGRLSPEVNEAFRTSPAGLNLLPVEFGGTSCTALGTVTLLEQITRRFGATVPMISRANTMMLAATLRHVSHHELLKTMLTESDYLGFSQAFTEPGAGTDTKSVKTIVTFDEGEVRLNGRKTFVSSGRQMPWTMVLAQDPTFGNLDGGLSLWMLPITESGVSMTPLKTIGQEMLAPTVVEFDNVRLYPNWKIPTEGNLNEILNHQYELGRLLICASSLGLAEAAFDDALDFATHHMSKGRLISGLPQIQEKLADIEISLRAMRLFIYEAAIGAERYDEDFQLNCALTKRYVPTAATEVASQCLQIFGGLGYTTETRVGRIWRDCRGNQIAQGTDEVMAHLSAKFLLRRRRQWEK